MNRTSCVSMRPRTHRLEQFEGKERAAVDAKREGRSEGIGQGRLDRDRIGRLAPCVGRTQNAQTRGKMALRKEAGRRQVESQATVVRQRRGLLPREAAKPLLVDAEIGGVLGATGGG